ncbi:Glycosyltransferase involved in cell wall bisynthesis [Zobellia uliginosa]|uniref:Glycosyltransferase involved in cell wall bisynthesis n=1 Tax=Zobellia uliginosa TaxID=143224 RepID=A0ABY1KMW2_9FLAO|nr:glycosyltransferase [Zobellia uliginosa]SIS51161.1 Glycosyltransferase involved in cell wall bisynthesis [Zobellia uliginosa]
MKKNKTKAIFIIPNLMPGGAERVMSFLAKNLNSSDFETTLLVLGHEANTAYDIMGVNVIFLNKTRVLTAIPNLILHLLKEKPQIIMSSIDHLNVSMGMISPIFTRIVFVGRQASVSKASSDYQAKSTNKFFSILRKWALRKLNYIVCQSYDMYLDCKQEYQIPENKLKIIHNPITENFSVKHNEPIDKNRVTQFITVGRLAIIKGHLRILNVLSNIKYPFVYTIIGSGPEKDSIKKSVDTLNLTSKVKFVDFTNDVERYLRESDFYLQGSFAEGFPNALLESCAVGTPVIVFDAPGGTREIVEDGVNGFIAKNEKEYLQHLNNLEHFDPKTVSNSVYSKFDKSIILEDYKSFFLSITKSK